MGQLEEEIAEMLRVAVQSTPWAISYGFVSEEEFVRQLGFMDDEEVREAFMGMHSAMLGAQKKALLRLAREIDALKPPEQ